jgi:hypothetical protein
MPSPYINNYGVVLVSASSLALTEAGYAGQTVALNIAGAQAVTLPAATGTGNVYRIFVAVTKTGASTVKVVGTDIIQGGVIVATDNGGLTFPTAADTDTITLAADTTTGGVIGSHLELQDVKTGVWRVSGFLVSAGAEATPFSATVS